ncbi:serine/arginine repetitive matrix protein 2 [Lingula anatina]|uniref:Serine/arginine repetitive matrix protein 2 n=1 Tax=Lingula anatina TaxID=7574 RepID=A0A1S3I940_LINAN|nr:serine/arginine repetitive matrix protein 2 [Lingula anatina]XP_013393904.1 serine/arginine repetitive matrix protein 2 [Lingula anatina]XP_013393914.1 serine/arginine repetitive matrix protein 2 [Lingula anatina]XP_013393922.1 serine/arginine repetitive matrix protein 2 [Lingula anatina]XP_013393931.1 serine/arginine repetitive matrix protein 2 [Lingula anatina]XP_013393939.1 serine/arginine repetitive matrix protein 2 [Lingula anatina]XP_013393947.1 serine/arginine repetitive matrix prot|eukprot:XP_013393897.1 serine/arginine repetitive matrix protein 2 [Lingula anatina]
MPHTKVTVMEEVTSPSDSQDKPNPGELTDATEHAQRETTTDRELNTEEFSKMADNFCKELKSISKGPKIPLPNGGSTKTSTSRRPSNPRNMMRCYSGTSLQQKSNTSAPSTNAPKRTPSLAGSQTPGQTKQHRKGSTTSTASVAGRANSKPLPRRQNSSPAVLRVGAQTTESTQKMSHNLHAKITGQKQSGAKSTMANGRSSPSVSGMSTGRRLSTGSSTTLTQAARPSTPRRGSTPKATSTKSTSPTRKTVSPKSTSPSRASSSRSASSRPSKPTATVRPTRIQTAENSKIAVSSSSSSAPSSAKGSMASDPCSNVNSRSANTNCDTQMPSSHVVQSGIGNNPKITVSANSNANTHAESNQPGKSNASDNATFVCTPGQHIVIPSWESGQYTIVVGANGDSSVKPAKEAETVGTVKENAYVDAAAHATSSSQMTRNIASIVIPIKGSPSESCPTDNTPDALIVPTVPVEKKMAAVASKAGEINASGPKTPTKALDTRPRQHIILPVQEGTLKKDSFKIVVDPEKGVQSIYTSNGKNLAVSENVNFHKNPEGGFTLTLPTAMHNAVEQSEKCSPGAENTFNNNLDEIDITKSVHEKEVQGKSPSSLVVENPKSTNSETSEKLGSKETTLALDHSEETTLDDNDAVVEEIEIESEMDQRISLLSSSISGIIAKATNDTCLYDLGRVEGSAEFTCSSHETITASQLVSRDVASFEDDSKVSEIKSTHLSTHLSDSSLFSGSLKRETESIRHENRSSIEVNTSHKNTQQYKVTYVGASSDNKSESKLINSSNDFTVKIDGIINKTTHLPPVKESKTEAPEDGDLDTTDPLLQVKQILLESGRLNPPKPAPHLSFLSVPDPDEFIGFNLSVRSRSNSRGSTCSEYEPVASFNITEEAFDAASLELDCNSESGSVSNLSETDSVNSSSALYQSGECVGGNNKNLRRNKNFSGLTIDVPDIWSSDDEEPKRSRFDDDFNSDEDNEDNNEDEIEENRMPSPLMSPGFAPSEFWTKAITDFEMKHGNLDQYTSMSSLTSTHSRRSSIGNLEQYSSMTSLCSSTPRRSASKTIRSKLRSGSLRSSTESLHSASSCESLNGSNHSLDVNENFERPRLGSFTRSVVHSIPKLVVEPPETESDDESDKSLGNSEIASNSSRNGSNLPGTRISPISLENYNLNRYDKDADNDLDRLKMMTTRMRLQTRRPSYQEWREEYIEKPLLVHLRQRKDSSSLQDEGITDEKDRREEINKAIEWLRKELMDMKNLDQELARKLITIQHDIRHLKLAKSCDEHQELLDDVREELEDRDQDRTSPLYEFPLLRINDTPLGQVGVTRMNLSRRRFSCC